MVLYAKNIPPSPVLLGGRQMLHAEQKTLSEPGPAIHPVMPSLYRHIPIQKVV